MSDAPLRESPQMTSTYLLHLKTPPCQRFHQYAAIRAAPEQRCRTSAAEVCTSQHSQRQRSPHPKCPTCQGSAIEQPLAAYAFPPSHFDSPQAWRRSRHRSGAHKRTATSPQVSREAFERCAAQPWSSGHQTGPVGASLRPEKASNSEVRDA